MLTFLFAVAGIWTLFWMIMFMIDYSDKTAFTDTNALCTTCGRPLPSVNPRDNSRSQINADKNPKSIAPIASNDDTNPIAQNQVSVDKHDQSNVKPLFVAPKEKDDLKVIKGIGVVMEKTLNDLGITTFKQLAGFKKADINRVNDALTGFDGRIERDEWVPQARDLMKKAS